MRPRSRYARHPWSLQGGAAPSVLEAIQLHPKRKLIAVADEIGFAVVTREDDAFRIGTEAALRAGVEPQHIRPLVAGEEVRDWGYSGMTGAVWPYDPDTLNAERDTGTFRLLWPFRRQLSERVAYGKTQIDRGLEWWEYSMFFTARFRTALSITFAAIATHNHFVLDRGGRVFKQSAPVIKLPEAATEDDHLELLGLLNSSTACFWMKQVFHSKGKGGYGGGIAEELWERFYDLDGTKLKQFPIPAGRTLVRARELEATVQELAASLPSAVLADAAPTRAALDAARESAEALRTRMIGLQEELDWQNYALYGLTDEELTGPSVGLPPIQKGLRAFEIVLARRMAAGELESTWFDRHGSTPKIDLPAEWPAEYRALVERRIELITSSRTIGLLERPEYKRRWNWDEWDQQEKAALRSWLLDRLELSELWAEPELTTTARLTDRRRHDEEFLEAARLLVGRIDVDLTEVVTNLIIEEAVPYAAGHRYKPSGLRKRREWEAVWAQQRTEDGIDARTELAQDHSGYLTPGAAKTVKIEQGLDGIPVPPKYGTNDLRSGTYWRLRGKLDVPKERFILYPDTRLGSDSTPVVGWAGWDHLGQARALASHYNTRKDEGAEASELIGLLAGLQELVPWLLQWHNELDPTFGQRMGDFFSSFTASEARIYGATVQDLEMWTPK